MSREMKFRAWDKKKKSWVTAALLPYNPWLVIEIHEESNNGGLHSLIGAENPDVEVSQYTGLKDKNGTEIYESDVLLHRSENLDIFMQVVWDGDAAAWGLRIKSQPKWQDYLEKGFASECEVVGNKYENR